MTDRWSDCKVVITGGLGFIGSNLAIRLVASGARVIVIDLPDSECCGHPGNLAPATDSIHVIRADLSLPGDWQQAVAEAEFVFHLAAQVSHSASMTNPLEDLSQNCVATLNVLAAARAAEQPPKTIFTSTRQVYGRAEALPLHEDHVREPTDINGVHKVAAEEYFRIYRDCFGLRTAVVRLTNTYGRRMDFRNPGRGALNVFIARALRGQPLAIFGDGLQRRDILHVDDVINALTAIAWIDDPGPFHLGQDQPTSLREFLQVLNAIVPVEIRQQPFPPDLKTIDIGDSHCDAERVRSATGWTPKVSLREGLAETIEWARSTPHALEETADRIR